MATRASLAGSEACLWLSLGVARLPVSLYFTDMSERSTEGYFEEGLSPYEKNRLALLDLQAQQGELLFGSKILQRAHAAATSIRFDHRGDMVVPIIGGQAPWRGFAYQVIESEPTGLKAVGCGIRIATPAIGPEGGIIEKYSDIPVWIIGHRACLPFIEDDGKIVAEVLRELRPHAEALGLTPDLAAIQPQTTP